MLQPSEQYQVATDNEMEEDGQDCNDVQPDLDEPGRQKANAGLKLLHPTELIAKLCGPLKKKYVRIVEIFVVILMFLLGHHQQE
jgi:hypothetical protein